MKRLMLILCLGLCTTAAHAANWVKAAENNAVEAFVDMQSLRVQGASAKVWVKWVYNTEQALTGIYPEKSYMMLKLLSVYRCNSRTTANLTGFYYSDVLGNEVAYSFQVPESLLSFSDIAPDTMGEAIWDRVCPKRK